MIVKIFSAGKSFKGLGKYLTHDAGADTAERVAWTHTLNCANDHAPSAIHEMYNTYLDAGLLKEEAGIRKGGRPLENPVKHFSLNWHPDESPTQEQMIAAVEGYLGHMGWQEHQAMLAAHSDKDHAHVHVMLNAVHPEAGRKLDDGLERRRSSDWAREYEREQGRIYCTQRLDPVEEREPSPTRPTWMALKEARRAQALADATRASAEQERHENEPTPPTASEEWNELKKCQRERREAFFGEESREAHRKLGRGVARQVREEFRERWADYFKLKDTDPDHFLLRDIHDGLVASQEERQKEVWEKRRLGLREAREEEYRGLLDAQKAERAELSARQARGGDPHHDVGLKAVEESPPFVARGIGSDSPFWDFRAAAIEATRPAGPPGEPTNERSRAESRYFEPAALDPRMRDAADIVAGVGLGMMGGAATLVERLLDGFFGGALAPTAPANDRSSPPEPAPNPFAAHATEARRTVERQQEEAIRDDWWDERRARARD